MKFLIIIIVATLLFSVGAYKVKLTTKISDKCVKDFCASAGGAYKPSGSGKGAFSVCQVGEWHFHTLGKAPELLFKKNGGKKGADFYCKCNLTTKKKVTTLSHKCAHREKGNIKTGCVPSNACFKAADEVVKRCK
jgi:hypothetical protein